MRPSSLPQERARRASAAVESLPGSYLGAPPGTDVSLALRLGDAGRAWGIRLTDRACQVSPSVPDSPDAEVLTDAGTFVAIREGTMLGVEAFNRGRIETRGDVEQVLAFEGHFRRPDGAPPRARVGRVALTGGEVSAMVAGEGREPVICLHGLGANKLSLYTTIAELAPTHTVHAIDLPGFGQSSKPARAPYDAAYFALTVRRYMDAMGITSAHLIGNSMGGRIAIELALSAPSRVRSLGLLAPAMAFLRRRELAPLVKLLRPELAAIPHPMATAIVKRQLRGLWADPERISPAIEEIAADSFSRAYRSRAARIAFYAAARNIYLESPHGETGFWNRLTGLQTPALFIWGENDRLVPAAFARHVGRALPAARSVVLEGCGHVPQLELPDVANGMLAEHIAANASPARARRRDRIRARLAGAAAL